MSMHDHELNIDGTADQYYLIRDDNGVAMYQVIEEIPQYQPKLTFEQTNWINGHGQFEYLDRDSYFEGQSIDTTQDGRICLGPYINEVKKSDDNDLDSAPVCFLWFSAINEWLCATSGNIYRYDWADSNINTNEEVNTSETGIDCTPDATTAIPVSSIIKIDKEIMTVSATGTTLTVARATNSVAASHSTATDIFIANGKWNLVGTTVAGVTHMVEFDGVAYAAIGSTTTTYTTEYYYSTDGITWVQTDLTDGFAEKFFVSTNAAGTDMVLWKFKHPNELSSTTNGKLAGSSGVQWTTAALIGDTSSYITNIFLINDELLIGREDNLYHYDSAGGIHAYMDDLKIAKSANNFKYVSYWQSGVYFSRWTGLGEITAASTFDPMGPLTDIDDIGKVGTCVGLAADTDWIYCAMDEGTNTHIYKMREARTSRGLKWQRCPWVFLGTNACATVAVCQHHATDKRLWFGYGVNTGYVVIADNPTAKGSGAKFAPSGFLRMSYAYGTDPNFDKLWQSAVIETSTIDASSGTVAASTGESVTVKYRDDDDSGAGASIIAAYITNGMIETNFTSALNNKRIQFELHLASTAGGSTATPTVTYFQAKGVEKPTTVRIHEAYYRIGDRPSDRAKTIRTLLRTGRSSTTLIKFADLRYGQKTSGTSSGDYVWCVMEAGYPREIEIKHEKSRQPELAILVRLREVSFTIS